MDQQTPGWAGAQQKKHPRLLMGQEHAGTSGDTECHKQDRRKLFCSASSKGKILTEYQIHSVVPDVKKDARELQEIQKKATRIGAGLGNKP